MTAETPGEDESGPPAPLAQPVPPLSEPAGFVSPAPAAWSTPAEWTPAAQPVWPAPDDSARQPSAGNGFSLTGADPLPAQAPAAAQAGQQGPPPGGPYGPTPPGPYSYQSLYYTPATLGTNRPAIAALVCGVAQFVFGLFGLNFLLAIPAVICGGIGMHQTKARGQPGRGLAIAGLVLGILGIVWNVVYVVLLIVVGAHFAPQGPPSSPP